VLQKHISKRLFSIEKRGQNLNIEFQKIRSGFFSFEEICPQWSLALRLGYTNNPNLDIKDAKNCIVGEAHGFRNRCLVCSKCWEYSQSFTFCTYGNKNHKYIITDSQRFEDLKFDFVSHFNQKHLLNRFHQQNILNLPIRSVPSVLRRFKNVSLLLSCMRVFAKIVIWF
jgi:hypothetical protein